MALFGLVPMFKKSRFAAIALLVFLLLTSWILSSWWNWWYGGSFSSRVMVEYLIFFMIPLALLIMECKRIWSKALVISLVVAFTILCQVQTYQYRYHKIHWENMDRESYWRVFMRLDQI
jgi:hypothetical protein